MATERSPAIAAPQPGAAERPRCAGCMHYYITYDPHFPYGCRAMNIKSKVPPHREVEAAAGIPCQTFMRRQKVPG